MDFNPLRTFAEEHRLVISTEVAHLLLLRRQLVGLLHGLRQFLDVGLAEALCGTVLEMAL